MWNEPRALPRAHISRLFPFSFSVARSFLFCSLHLSVIPTLQGCRGGGSLWIFSFAPAMKWWTTPPFAVTPPRRATRAFRRRFPTEKKSLTLGFLPRFLHANRTIGSLNFRASEELPSVSFIKINPPLLATDVIARRRYAFDRTVKTYLDALLRFSKIVTTYSNIMLQHII